MPLPPAAFEASPAPSTGCTRGFSSMRLQQHTQISEHQAPAVPGGQQLPASSHCPEPYTPLRQFCCRAPLLCGLTTKSFPWHPRGHTSSKFHWHDTTVTFLSSCEPQPVFSSTRSGFQPCGVRYLGATPMSAIHVFFRVLFTLPNQFFVTPIPL